MATGNSDKIAAGVVIIGGVLALTIFAGMSEELGKVLVIFMLGILLLWVMGPGSALIKKWTNTATS